MYELAVHSQQSPKSCSTPPPPAVSGCSLPLSSRFPCGGAWLATHSHSASVGSRHPRQRAKASASKKLMWHTGVSSSPASPCQPFSVKRRQPVLSLVSPSQ